MSKLCFTVDVDRDVNVPIPGAIASGSLDRGDGCSPRFHSSGKGLELLLELSDSLGMKTTFFIESTTLKETGMGGSLSKHEIAFHGVDHEDFTGTTTSVPLTLNQKETIIANGINSIIDMTSIKPVGFRFPYMSPDTETYEILKRNGIKYDSSVYDDISNPTVRKMNGMVEVAVPTGMWGGRKITSYLWPMHEGVRSPEDFIGFGSQCKDILILSTHSWHMWETRKNGIMSYENRLKNLSNTRVVLETLFDKGFKPVSMADVISDVA